MESRFFSSGYRHSNLHIYLIILRKYFKKRNAWKSQKLKTEIQKAKSDIVFDGNVEKLQTIVMSLKESWKNHVSFFKLKKQFNATKWKIPEHIFISVTKNMEI